MLEKRTTFALKKRVGAPNETVMLSNSRHHKKCLGVLEVCSEVNAEAAPIHSCGASAAPLLPTGCFAYGTWLDHAAKSAHKEGNALNMLI